MTEADGLSAGGGLGGLLGGAGDGGGIWADGEGGVLGGCHGVGELRVCMWSQTARGGSDVVLECAVAGILYVFNCRRVLVLE